MFPTSSSGAITSIFGASSIALSNLMIPASICILACLVAASLPMLPSWQKRLLLLAALGMLAVLVVLSVLRLFCHDPSRCLYAARNCNQSFWDGAKKTGGVHELADRRVDAGAAPTVCFQTVYLRVGEPVSRARHVVNGLQYERRLCFRQRTRGSSTRRMHDDAACQTDIGVY